MPNEADKTNELFPASTPRKEVKMYDSYQWDNLASCTFFASVKLPNGETASFNLRYNYGMEPEKFYEWFKGVYQAMDMMTKDHDVKIWSGGKQSEPAKPETPPAPAAPSTPSGSQAGSNGHAPEFKCGNLDVEFKGKGQERKAYYSISGAEGAKFPQFPVRVWPEVLEDAGIIAAEVDPVKGMPLIGWVATYEKDENNKIKKVVKLSKPDFA